jgi:photosystem II stability/assembly factor-like uncharacterized protein
MDLRIASDRVNPRKFYAVNASRGVVYASTDAGAHFESTVTNLAGLADWALDSASIQAMPNFEGDVWLTLGKSLLHSTDAGRSYREIANVTESHALGFGKPAPRRSHSALFLVGKVSGVAGLFRSDDSGKSFVRINDDSHQFGVVSRVTGDPRVFGRVYLGTGGRGILVGAPR